VLSERDFPFLRSDTDALLLLLRTFKNTALLFDQIAIVLGLAFLQFSEQSLLGVWRSCCFSKTDNSSTIRNDVFNHNLLSYIIDDAVHLF